MKNGQKELLQHALRLAAGTWVIKLWYREKHRTGLRFICRWGKIKIPFPSLTNIVFLVQITT